MTVTDGVSAAELETGTAAGSAAALEARLAPLREELLAHPIFATVDGLGRLREFTRWHAFAVWDFMTLLKRLQRDLTGVGHPWCPPARPELARFVNEIVLGEESDEDGRGGHASHFELYIEAMRDIDADTGPIESFVETVRAGSDPHGWLVRAPIPAEVRDFVSGNLELAARGGTHEVAAAFCFGREDPIPAMFGRIVQTIRREGLDVPRLVYYLQRHIDLDGDHHGPLARRMVTTLCEGHPANLESAAIAAEHALRARLRLWDGILDRLPNA